MPLPDSPVYARPGEQRPFARPNRPVHAVFVHCSASDEPEHDDVSVIRRWHTDPVQAGGRGWADIGYHFFITKDGTIQPGRSVERTPAAQLGHNAGTIAVSLHGLAEKRFTQAQLDSLAAFCRAVQEAYRGRALRFRGHCEVANKACPVVNYRRVLGLGAGGQLGGVPATVAALTDDPIAEDTCLDLMDHGALVRAAQAALNAEGAGLELDGVFGQRTREAVARFQRRRGLPPDGIIGPATRAELRF